MTSWLTRDSCGAGPSPLRGFGMGSCGMKDHAEPETCCWGTRKKWKYRTPLKASSLLAGFFLVATHGARDQDHAPDQQNQHQHGVEQAGGSVKDVHVGDHARQNEQRA